MLVPQTFIRSTGQKEYRDVYERLKEVNIESVALKIIADSVNEKVLSRLRGLLAENIGMYETRCDDFNGIRFDELYQLWEDRLFADKRALLLKDAKYLQLRDDKAAMGALYNFQGIPFLVLISPDGTILERNLRGQQLVDTVNGYMER